MKNNRSGNDLKKCNTCGETIRPNCDWRQGRCPHLPPMVSAESLKKFLERYKINMTSNKKQIKQPDPTWHRNISFVKSVLRIAGFVFLMGGGLWPAGALLILAEVLGVAEELV
jgi:hypothetical protein